MIREMNFDGLVGPTHNYAGLSFGNLASAKNRGLRSNPKAAALQGLSKMRALAEMGLWQGVLPPHERPNIPALRDLGFSGAAGQVIETAWKEDPQLTAILSSASAMWTANAATVSPAADSADGRTHLSPANLIAMPHRSFEAAFTQRLLEAAFPDPERFAVHPPLPATRLMSDEGAANHNRMCGPDGAPGLQIFVYGVEHAATGPLSLPARQTLDASRAIARRHRLDPAATLFLQQGRAAIDAGAFHNDVVCVTNGDVVMFHERAFEDAAEARDAIARAADPLGFTPVFLMAKEADLGLEDAINSYVFNSQLITRPDGEMALILPGEAEETPAARRFAEECVAGENPIAEARFFDLRESMRNGGGPACLRLRVALSEDAHRAVHDGLKMDEARIGALEDWVEKHYRDRLEPDDLGDPALVTEVRAALDELTSLLDLGALYDFQREPDGAAA